MSIENAEKKVEEATKLLEEAKRELEEARNTSVDSDKSVRIQQLKRLESGAVIRFKFTKSSVSYNSYNWMKLESGNFVNQASLFQTPSALTDRYENREFKCVLTPYRKETLLNN